MTIYVYVVPTLNEKRVEIYEFTGPPDQYSAKKLAEKKFGLGGRIFREVAEDLTGPIRQVAEGVCEIITPNTPV